MARKQRKMHISELVVNREVTGKCLTNANIIAGLILRGIGISYVRINYISEKVKVRIMKRLKGLHIIHASWDFCNSDDLEINRNRHKKCEKDFL